MNRARLFTALAAAGLLAACSTAPSGPIYYTPGAAPVPVAGSSAPYSAGTGTVAGGVNTFSAGDRVIVGEPATRTTTGEAGATAATGTVIGGSTLNPGANSGTPAPTPPATPDAQRQPPSR